MERIVLSKKFFINALFIVIVAIMIVSIIIEVPNDENKTIICVVFSLLDVFFAFLNAYYIPFAFYFDEYTVEIRYMFKRKSKEWLWKDITKIELEHVSFYDIATVPSFNIGARLFRKSFRLEHVDEDGKAEYERIVKSKATKQCIEQYGQVEIIGE